MTTELVNSGKPKHGELCGTLARAGKLLNDTLWCKLSSNRCLEACCAPLVSATATLTVELKRSNCDALLKDRMLWHFLPCS